MSKYHVFAHPKRTGPDSDSLWGIATTYEARNKGDALRQHVAKLMPGDPTTELVALKADDWKPAKVTVVRHIALDWQEDEDDSPSAEVTDDKE